MSDKKILVIDDDSDIIDSVKAVLTKEGYKVITATNGKAGYDIFKKEKPDMVLCDMMMEKIDAGSKVAEMIKKEDKNIPVYLLSSIGNAADANVSIGKLGFTGVFQKPVDPADLISQVKKVLK